MALDVACRLDEAHHVHFANPGIPIGLMVFMQSQVMVTLAGRQPTNSVDIPGPRPHFLGLISRS